MDSCSQFVFLSGGRVGVVADVPFRIGKGRPVDVCGAYGVFFSVDSFCSSGAFVQSASFVVCIADVCFLGYLAFRSKGYQRPLAQVGVLERLERFVVLYPLFWGGGVLRFFYHAVRAAFRFEKAFLGAIFLQFGDVWMRLSLADSQFYLQLVPKTFQRRVVGRRIPLNGRHFLYG